MTNHLRYLAILGSWSALLGSGRLWSTLVGSGRQQVGGEGGWEHSSDTIQTYESTQD